MKRFALVASRAKPSRTRIASIAPASLRLLRGSTLGSSITLLMSQRPQRSSVSRMAALPSDGGGGSASRAKAKTVGFVPSGGKAWYRGAAPRETCA